MWPYKNHRESDYRAAVDYVESIAIKYGAKEVDLQTETFTDISESWIVTTKETMKVFKYKDEYFRIEPHFLPHKPFMVLSFGETIESIYDDADPFPYDLAPQELEKEVRYSLGIEDYP